MNQCREGGTVFMTGVTGGVRMSKGWGQWQRISGCPSQNEPLRRPHLGLGDKETNPWRWRTIPSLEGVGFHSQAYWEETGWMWTSCWSSPVLHRVTYRIPMQRGQGLQPGWLTSCSSWNSDLGRKACNHASCKWSASADGDIAIPLPSCGGGRGRNWNTG